MDLPPERPVRDVVGHGSKVVFFANLPKDDEQKKELLTISRRFGTVDKHLFLTDQVTPSLTDQVTPSQNPSDCSQTDILPWRIGTKSVLVERRNPNQEETAVVK